MSQINRGVDVISATLRDLPLLPGVYRMLDAEGNVLYVGKARVLQKRVASYTRPYSLPVRLQRMIAQTHAMIFIVTHTEGEALLLESNLIKQLAPPYNILLRDDKSFAYIKLTQHPYPLLTKHRGALDKESTYFGPFASTSAVNGTIEALYKIFKLRSCADTIFNNRNRPCLQYHIKRCSAPCVGLISESDYAQDIKNAKAFLGQKSKELLDKLSQEMQKASDGLNFEEAAKFRDQIQVLSQIQQQQGVNVQGIRDADVVAMHQAGGLSCIQLFCFRNGRNYGNRPYFIHHHGDESAEDVMITFLMQFYQEHVAPPLILLSHPLGERDWIEAALRQKFNHKVEVLTPARGLRKKVVDQAHMNAKEALQRKLADKQNHAAHLKQVQALFDLPRLPLRIEVYDNSHLFGKDAYGGMVVVNSEGFDKKEYRKFKIETAQSSSGGDDYGMMREVMLRRFRKNDVGEVSKKPDLLLIDGGQGQLSAVRGALDSLGIHDVAVVAIAKGPHRNAGEETFFMEDKAPFQLSKQDSTLYFLQRLRDEAHRFVISAHRQKRQKTMDRSTLDDVPGVGPARKKALLHHFGSSYNVSRAGLEDLQSVKGIDSGLAEKIYHFFHQA